MIFSYLRYLNVFLLFLIGCNFLARGSTSGEISYDQNYAVIYGGSHFVPLNQGKEIQLILDNTSGAGFGSKMKYGSGYFHMRMKVPGGDTTGVATAYYLTSHGNKHNELDFEFMGDTEGMPYKLQTNIFIDDIGDREQRIHLWFDPIADIHDYVILWNQHQIVFYVDNIPIRIYKNKTNIGVPYPSKPMKIEATLWHGEWAIEGKRKTNWSYAPFKANYQGFGVSGCEVQSLNDQHCVSDSYWWNGEKFWQLDSVQQKQYESVNQKYIVYDYCTDRRKHPTTPLDCTLN
ncbi:xyloglucan endotransglucosylase/hydrolase protein 2-like [Abrus precatorius]|uniref:Xyloglucan endotransglucosylase/hydrolase n=1 Tax=Abrus precatorius TaxID=3816 RepID=A0A8B8K055_ABRPR|nr:xyloglucan endotransglucosylase/hydrolase protein 2-like [Abrus precatorius]